MLLSATATKRGSSTCARPTTSACALCVRSCLATRRAKACVPPVCELKFTNCKMTRGASVRGFLPFANTKLWRTFPLLFFSLDLNQVTFVASFFVFELVRYPQSAEPCSGACALLLPFAVSVLPASARGTKSCRCVHARHSMTVTSISPTLVYTYCTPVDRLVVTTVHSPMLVKPVDLGSLLRPTTACVLLCAQLSSSAVYCKNTE